MGRARRGTQRSLGVILGEFPSTSETFILREMLQLEEQGFELVPFALDRPREERPHADAEDLAKRTIYREPPLSAGCLLRQAAAMIRFPAGYASALVFVIKGSLSAPSTARELLSSLLAAGCFALAAPRRRRCSHIHAQFCSMTATVGLLLAEILGVTFSMSCHARDIFTRESILLGRKLSEAEFTAVCTRHGLERLRREHRLVAGENVHLIYHGIDPSRFMPPPEPPSRPPIVLTVGRLVQKKGFDILLRAAALAHSRGAQFELHIVGEGPERDDLERLAGGLGLRDMTTFHGRLTQEELIPLYQQAHASAIASIVIEDGDRDGIPNVLLEALAMGIPTVATSTGGIPELIVHEETGLIAQPGDHADLADQLERIIYDEELRDHVRKAGRQKIILEFDISRNIEKLAALLDKYVPRRSEEGTTLS